METFIYAIIFIIGTFFGSFFTLAVYRLPKKEDILIKHSYCPNCNHKLGFFDLFPVLSYILLGAKCRYCKNKIRPRYLILELFSGFTFLMLAISLKINILNIHNVINLVFLLIYVSALFIIAGIDKENIKIQKNVLVFGYIIEILYMIYLYALDKFNVYQYVIYLFVFLIILVISIIANRLKKNKEYLTQILYLSLYIIIMCGIKIYLITAMLCLIIILAYKLFGKLANNRIPVGFILCVSNIATIIIFNVITNYII